MCGGSQNVGSVVGLSGIRTGTKSVSWWDILHSVYPFLSHRVWLYIISSSRCKHIYIEIGQSLETNVRCLCLTDSTPLFWLLSYTQPSVLGYFTSLESFLFLVPRVFLVPTLSNFYNGKGWNSRTKVLSLGTILQDEPRTLTGSRDTNWQGCCDISFPVEGFRFDPPKLSSFFFVYDRTVLVIYK